MSIVIIDPYNYNGSLDSLLSPGDSQYFCLVSCPEDQNWRRNHKNRKPEPDISNIKIRYSIVESAAAKDVIAVITRFYLDCTDYIIRIISNDLIYKNLVLWHPERIIAEHLGNPIELDQPYDLEYVPRYIQDHVLNSLSLLSLVPSRNIPRYYRPLKIQLGLCCMHTKLRERNIFCSRTMRVKTVEEKGLQVIYEKSIQNCRDLITMIEYIAENDGIRVFRISSEIFPHKSNTKVQNYSLDFARDLLEYAGDLARRYKMRLTFHPGQYNVVGTPHVDKFIQTCNDLDWHAEVLDMMGCDNDCTMVVHGGGIYGDKELTIKRWVKQFFKLPLRVQKRLVLENCEKCFSIEDCIKVSDMIYERNQKGIPIVFDTHHYNCYNMLHPDDMMKSVESYLDKILETWNRKSIKPLFHISDQKEGSRIGAHSDFIKEVPEYLLELSKKQPIDIMVEAKQKEQAIKFLYKKYPYISPTFDKIKLKQKQ
jgi:UV DNA damage endonuclease